MAEIGKQPNSGAWSAIKKVITNKLFIIAVIFLAIFVLPGKYQGWYVRHELHKVKDYSRFLNWGSNSDSVNVNVLCMDRCTDANNTFVSRAVGNADQLEKELSDFLKSKGYKVTYTTRGKPPYENSVTVIGEKGEVSIDLNVMADSGYGSVRVYY